MVNKGFQTLRDSKLKELRMNVYGMFWSIGFRTSFELYECTLVAPCDGKRAIFVSTRK